MIDMKLKKVIQNTCLSEEKSQNCNPLVEEQTLEHVPQPEIRESSKDAGMHTSPYSHREIF